MSERSLHTSIGLILTYNSTVFSAISTAIKFKSDDIFAMVETDHLLQWKFEIIIYLSRQIHKNIDENS